MSLGNLEVLKQHKKDLLLAEVGAWLHDYRKCSDEQLRAQAANIENAQGLERREIETRFPIIESINISLPAFAPEKVVDLLKWDDKRHTRPNLQQLGLYLIRCHHTSHFDKQDIQQAGDNYGKQDYPKIQVSSSFGFEQTVFPQQNSAHNDPNSTQKLWKLPWHDLVNYNAQKHISLRRKISDLFSQTVADTRRPINEVDLWSWGMLVGALYKSALAGAILTGTTPAACDLRWRLLNIRADGLGYLLDAARIPDLLARQELLADSLNRVRELLEITYPLGSEVYRDENGSIYVVPNIADLLDRTDEHGVPLRALIVQAFAKGTVKGNPRIQLGGEIMPQIEIESTPWWGQDPDRLGKTQLDKKTNQPKNPQLYGQELENEIPSIGNFLAQDVILLADPDCVADSWQSRPAADICTVCGLRPQGAKPKAADRKVCDICEERRADRSKTWVHEQFNTTIWNDEVADVNGRMALMIGRFDLQHWLDGSLIETLLLIAPHDPQNKNGAPITSKTSSFARLRRVWETTRAFWQDVKIDTLQALIDDRRRLKLYLDRQTNLGPYHVYDLVLGATDLSVVWVPPQDDKDGYLLTADNLGYTARQLEAEKDIYKHPATAAIFVEDYLNRVFVNGDKTPVLHNSDMPKSRAKNLLRGCHINRVEYQATPYAPVIPILSEPQVFMALVPADKALDVARAIKSKYEREMGKVRNRLPLHLGLVFAGRRIPLQAILDAGRAMLKIPSQVQTWTVTAKAPPGSPQNDKDWPAEVCLRLEREGRSIEVKIPTVMGDGKTPDQWYPYVFLKTSAELVTRKRRFRAPNPWTGSEGWLVHAGDLEEGDEIYFTPSTFDFEYLDSTARRFNIYYDRQGRRPRPTRPYYLEDLGRMDDLWDSFSKLSRTQLKQIIQTIETTRERWFGDDHDRRSLTDGVFRQFVADTLAKAGLLSLRGRRPKQSPFAQQEIASPPAAARNDKQDIITAAARGELADLAELHLEILKEKMKGETA